MENFNPGFYDILGRIPRYSTPEEIKKAYRTLAKHYHPDKHDDKAYANEMMKKLNEARDILSDPVKRAEYDDALDGFMRKKEEEELRRKENQRSRPQQSLPKGVNVPGIVGVVLAILALGLLLNAILSRKK